MRIETQGVRKLIDTNRYIFVTASLDRHAGLDPASRIFLDSGFRRNDYREVFESKKISHLKKNLVVNFKSRHYSLLLSKSFATFVLLCHFRQAALTEFFYFHTTG